MNIMEVKSLLDEHKDEIQAFETKNERIDCVIRLLEKTYHNAPINGSIEDFVTALNHIDIQFVLEALRELKTREHDAELVANSMAIDDREIVLYIQHLVSIVEQ